MSKFAVILLVVLAVVLSCKAAKLARRSSLSSFQGRFFIVYTLYKLKSLEQITQQKKDLIPLPRREGASLLFSPIRPRPTHYYQCDVT